MVILKQNKIFQRFALGFLVILLVSIPFLSVIHTAEAQQGMSNEEYKAILGKVTAESVNAPFVTDEQLVRDLSQPANKDKNNPKNAAAGATQGNTDVPPLTKLGLTIGNMVIEIAAKITGFGGVILEFTMKKLVLEMGTLINGSGMGVVINQAWTTIRDICNLAFIFGFIYIGIRTIIDADSGASKKFLASLIIGAVLINFSLFFTKVVIDVSNYIAVEVVHTMKDGEGSISDKYTSVLKVSSLYTPPQNDPQLLANITNAGVVGYFIMAALFLIVAGFVLAAGGILLIFRFAQLVFIMIFSPILFAATVFPQTAKYAGDLWHRLISQAFFAPVYLFLLLVSLRLLEGATRTLNTTHKNLSDAIISPDAYDIVLIFLICIMFLIMSLKAAQSMGAVGADKALAFGKDLRMRGQRAMGTATAGLAAASGRATFGRLANSISEREGLKDAASKSGIRGFAARQALKSSRVVGDSSFDARNVAGVGKALGVGEGRKGGYKTVKEEVKKKEEEFARSLGEVKDDDVFVEARKNEITGEEKKVDKHKEELLDLREKKKLAQAARNVAEENRLSGLIENKKTEIEKQEKAVADAKLKYESEKQRRIIGSTYAKHPDQATLDAQGADIKRLKDDLKREWETYVALPDEARKEAYRPNIEALKANLKARQDERDELLRKQPDRGYAGVLQKSTRITAWPFGRLAHMEQSVGKEIRKTAEKGLPKEK